MGAGEVSTGKFDEKLTTGGMTNQLIFAFIALGILTFGIGMFTDAARTWRSYLLHNIMFLGLGFGSMLFLCFHYLAGSGWFVLVRRIPEAMADYLKVGVVTTFVLLLGLSHIYPWTDHAMMESEHFLHHKTAYFSTGFFIARMVLFFAVVLYFSSKVLTNSLRQDSEGGVDLRNKQKPLSAMFLVLFAPLFTVFAVDMVKSLEPKWFSTIFGVYMFAGFIQTSIAVMVIAIFLLKRSGYMSYVRNDHVHDLGKYMFGFSIFYAYIGISQYLLIWYANLPEENFYYANRSVGSWPYVAGVLILTKFLIPFLFLLPRAAKRNLTYVASVACVVVFSEWIDLNWMIMPSYSQSGFILGWQDIGFFFGFLGLFSLIVRRFLSKNAMSPIKDPYLHESKAHHIEYA